MLLFLLRAALDIVLAEKVINVSQASLQAHVLLENHALLLEHAGILVGEELLNVVVEVL